MPGTNILGCNNKYFTLYFDAVWMCTTILLNNFLLIYLYVYILFKSTAKYYLTTIRLTHCVPTYTQK